MHGTWTVYKNVASGRFNSVMIYQAFSLGLGYTVFQKSKFMPPNLAKIKPYPKIMYIFLCLQKILNMFKVFTGLDLITKLLVYFK